MASDTLTKAQRNLVSELDQIFEEFNFDYRNIGSFEAEVRTPYLYATRDRIVRGQVIVWYTLLDELLANKICRYHFGRGRSFPELWRTKRFRNFNHYVMDELHLLQKLRYVRTFTVIPKELVADMERLNALRNGIAHSFFPENRRAKPKWKDQDIFSVEGLRSLYADFGRMRDHLWEA